MYKVINAAADSDTNCNRYLVIQNCRWVIHYILISNLCHSMYKYLPLKCRTRPSAVAG